MTIPQISPSTVLMNPAEVTPQAQIAQIFTVAKAKDAFDKDEEKKKSDSVNISKEALRMAKDAEKADNSLEYKKDREGQLEDSDL